MHAKLLQLCPTLCDPMDCSLPASSAHAILQARILEWVGVLSPEDLPDPGIEPRSPTLLAFSLPSEPPGKPLVQSDLSFQFNSVQFSHSAMSDSL